VLHIGSGSGARGSCRAAVLGSKHSFESVPLGALCSENSADPTDAAVGHRGGADAPTTARGPTTTVVTERGVEQLKPTDGGAARGAERASIAHGRAGRGGRKCRLHSERRLLSLMRRRSSLLEVDRRRGSRGNGCDRVSSRSGSLSYPKPSLGTVESWGRGLLTWRCSPAIP